MKYSSWNSVASYLVENIKKKIENTINNLEMAIRKLKQYDSAVADILDDKDLFEFNKK